MSGQSVAPIDKRDSFGCSMSSIDEDRTLSGANLTFHRKHAFQSGPGQIVAPGRQGYLLGLSLEGGHRRRIFHEHHSTLHDFAPGSVYLRNQLEDYKADLSGAFNFILVEISQTALTALADGADMPDVNDLREVTADLDPVFSNLAQTLFAPMPARQETSSLFLDHMSTAIGIHILQKYGNGRRLVSDRLPRLSPGMEARAKDTLLDRLATDIGLDEVATACNMSRGTFVRAFRQTTGKTPHRWLAEQRIGKAQDMLRMTGRSLADIALTCGFSDQSHFTRAFAAATGSTPGNWRRQVLA